MPLILHRNIENGEFGLWKISEEVEELRLLANLSEQDATIYSGISATHRKKEWLSARVLLNTLITPQQQIKYHQDGRPYLENSKVNISISHSTGYLAILLHSTSIPGIDIEHRSRQVGRVASRFLSPEELAASATNDQHLNFRRLIHWCAKEAIFKMVPLSNIEFATDIRIFLDEVLETSGSFRGIFHDKSGPITIPLYYLIEDEILIVWGWVNESQFKSCCS